MSSAISNSLSSITSNASQPAATIPTDPLANESTFLTLLVSQLKNQDPLNPTDSTQFVSQLTAYSQLEQLIGIHANTTTLTTAAPSPATAAGNGASGSPATTASAVSSTAAAAPAVTATTARAAAVQAFQSLL